MVDRAGEIARFLALSGWQGAARRVLAGDASVRRYERVTDAGRRAILMDSPAGTGDSPADFVRIARHLRAIGLNAPDILAADLESGFLLLEDFGDDTFARVMADRPATAGSLYTLACDALVHLQSAPPAPDLPDLSAPDWAEAATVCLSWYAFALTGERADPAALQGTLTEALLAHADGPRVMILRDYHAENLMWLPDRTGLAQAGILDFQLAQLGQPGYDLVSLLQDARRDVPETVQNATIQHFCAATETDPDIFARSYAVLGVQRALRILGIFARLCLVEGKCGYLVHLPRVWRQLQTNLAQPDLAPLGELCNRLLPVPDAAALEMMSRQCARHSLP